MDTQLMLSVEAMAEKISGGGLFFLAGEERLLKRLPKGDWIGGTTPYFMTESGGTEKRDLIYAVELPPYITGAEIKVYDRESLAGVYKDAPENGFSLIVIPAMSGTHLAFALDAPGYEDFAASPLVGWISGVPLAELGKTAPLVFDGRSGRALADGAVVMHAALPRGKRAELGLLNMFEPSDGDILSFTGSGFGAKEVMVNGRARGFAEYLAEKKLDTQLPLVADYGGTMVNVSFQGVDAATKEVTFYAPVFKGVEYRQARPLGVYRDAFAARRPSRAKERLVFSCNCILNYLYAGLEEKPVAGFSGPVTFGEVAYQLLNQTGVYLEISDTNLAGRLRDETARQRRYHLLETLMDTLPNPVYYTDAGGRFIGCNRAYEIFLGRQKKEILGRTVGELLPEEAAAVCAEKDSELFRRPGSLSYAVETTDRSGDKKHLVFYTATFTAPGGRVAGLIGVISDITTHKLAEERLAAAYEELKRAQDRLVQSEKMSAVGQLAAGVAHEINNPLGIILGFAQGLAGRTKENDPLYMPLRSIEREAVRCRDLVQDLLVFSRSSDLEAEPVDLKETVEGALSLILARARTRNVEIAVELTPGLARIQANKNQLQQIIVNLGNNAIDALAAGGKVTIRAGARAGMPGFAELQVQDNGEGIPAGIKGRIFEPFFTTKEAGKGTGLGLSLVYEIIKKHKGTIEVESAEGKGTKFTMLLPFAAPPPDPGVRI